MIEAMNIMYNRRAVRKYKDLPVDKNIIDQILDAGRMAPSGMNLQPWKFYVVTDHSLIHDFDQQVSLVVKDIYSMPEMTEFINKPNAIFHGAPVVIFLTAPKMDEWAALDVGMCAQNIMLSAKSLGLDTCPVGLGKFIERTSFYSLLNIPESENILISLTLGYGNESLATHERKKDNVVYVRPGLAHKV